MKRPPLATLLLNWYTLNARQLPWRSPPGKQPDPYKIWVSEIMLQQTRVETVAPYFERWMRRFPTLEVLAQSTLQVVLAAWEGLGYYGRARNLLHSAQLVVQEHDGELPKDARMLRKLPGIGRYTAGALASIAFGADEPALDGNIRRLLARVFNVAEPARSPASEQRLWELAAANLPPGQAGDYNQALMDLGATICTPREPACPNCPLAEVCQARLLGVQTERPVVRARPVVPHYTVTAAVIERQGQFLIAQRPLKGLLGGLWEFPGGKLQPGEDLAACLQREILEELGVEVRVGGALGVFRHAYTHFRVTLHAYHCSLLNGHEPQAVQVRDLHWVTPGEMSLYPMGKIDRQIAAQLVGAP